MQSAPEPVFWINILPTLKATNQTMSRPLLRIQWLLPELRIGAQEGSGESRETCPQTFGKACPRFVERVVLETSCSFFSLLTSSSPRNLLLLTFSFSYYLVLGQISQVKGSVLCPYTRHQLKFKEPQATLTSDPLATKSGIPTTPSGSKFAGMTHRTQERATQMIIVLLQQRDTNQKQSKGRTYSVRSERILNTKLPSSSGSPIYMWQYEEYCKPGSSPKLRYPEILLVLHHVGTD